MKKNMFIGLLLVVIVVALIIGVSGSKGKISSKGVSHIGPQIALVRIEGQISGGKQEGVFGAGEIATAENIMQNLRDAAEDPNTSAIIIRINSPGGSAPAAQEIGEEVKKIRKSHNIPIITSMGDVAASGGYWIAATTDKIMANPSTMTGSIGVIMETQSLKELYQKLGVKLDNIKSGPHKDMGSTARELTPEEKTILQNMVDDIYEQFLDIVSEGRNLPKDKVREIADGRIFTGRQAKELKLVDALGNYYDAIDYAQKLTGIEGEPNIVEYGTSSPWSIFNTKMSMPPQQTALEQLVTELLRIKGVQLK